MIIGITGSIGSGKTTAAKIFSRYHFKRIDADRVGHEIIKKHSRAYKKTVAEFGVGILDKNKNINRKKLGCIVFSDNKKLKKFDSIVHPLIIGEIKNQIKKIKAMCGSDAKMLVDAPLLFETKADRLVDKTIVVKADKKLIVKRLGKKYTRQEIEKILKAQMPLGEKLKKADFVVDNNKDLRHLEAQVKKIIRIIGIKNENSSLPGNV